MVNNDISPLSAAAQSRYGGAGTDGSLAKGGTVGFSFSLYDYLYEFSLGLVDATASTDGGSVTVQFYTSVNNAPGIPASAAVVVPDSSLPTGGDDYIGLGSYSFGAVPSGND